MIRFLYHPHLSHYYKLIRSLIISQTIQIFRVKLVPFTSKKPTSDTSHLLNMSPMATSNNYAFQHSSSQRAVAMVLALVSAIVLSPLYIDRRGSEYRYETKWSSGFVLPVVLAGLIVAIKTTSSSSNSTSQRGTRSASSFPSSEPSSVLKIGGSSWGLAGILVMLMFVLSWQSSVQHFFWR